MAGSTAERIAPHPTTADLAELGTEAATAAAALIGALTQAGLTAGANYYAGENARRLRWVVRPTPRAVAG